MEYTMVSENVATISTEATESMNGKPSVCTAPEGMEDCHMESTDSESNGQERSSDIVILRVGRDRKMFKVDGFVLCQSPVLRRICIERLMGGEELDITLPFDIVERFEEILGYLHTGLYQPKCQEWKDKSIELVTMYLTAGKYKLRGLQILVVGHFADCKDHHIAKPVLLFECARIIYSESPASDELFADFFKPVAQAVFTAPRKLSVKAKKLVRTIISAGGKLATDISCARAMAFQVERGLNAHGKRAATPDADAHDDLEVKRQG